jgi:hypothetical protein
MQAGAAGDDERVNAVLRFDYGDVRRAGECDPKQRRSYIQTNRNGPIFGLPEF